MKQSSVACVLFGIASLVGIGCGDNAPTPAVIDSTFASVADAAVDAASSVIDGHVSLPDATPAPDAAPSPDAAPTPDAAPAPFCGDGIINGDEQCDGGDDCAACQLIVPTGQDAYVKASNTAANDQFGSSVAISADGDTMVVGAPRETSPSTGINGSQTPASGGDPTQAEGAVYVFVRNNNAAMWSQQAYLKQPTFNSHCFFGNSVTLSADGNTLAVGGQAEAAGAGEVVVFHRSGDVWSQQAVLTEAVPTSNDNFGVSVALSTDGFTLVVGDYHDSTSAVGIDGDASGVGPNAAGAAYVFVSDGNDWTQQAYIKAPIPIEFAAFGGAVTVSGDGNTLAVGMQLDPSNATGVSSTQSSDASLSGAGSVFVYVRSNTTWTLQSYVKASNTQSNGSFGKAIALSADGATLAVGAIGDSSDATGINQDQTDTSMQAAGAVFVFTTAGGTWAQQAYVKASNTAASLEFGNSVALTADGKVLVVGGRGDRGDSTGINGTNSSTGLDSAGAAYVYVLAGATPTWVQEQYVKASNTASSASFGSSLAVAPGGVTIVVGASGESSDATGIGGDQSDTSAASAGAAYVFDDSND